jgi:hypothetical protein
MATTLTSEAAEGYKTDSPTVPYLATSDSASAWHIGVWLRTSGRSSPRDVRASRGDTYHVNDMKVRVRWRDGTAEVERIS